MFLGWAWIARDPAVCRADRCSRSPAWRVRRRSRRGNAASIRAFEKAGFTRWKTVDKRARGARMRDAPELEGTPLPVARPAAKPRLPMRLARPSTPRHPRDLRAQRGRTRSSPSSSRRRPWTRCARGSRRRCVPIHGSWRSATASSWVTPTPRSTASARLPVVGRLSLLRASAGAGPGRGASSIGCCDPQAPGIPDAASRHRAAQRRERAPA
jgi:hypothetical protein